MIGYKGTSGIPLTRARFKIIGTAFLLLLITAAILAAVIYGGGLLWDTINPESTATVTPTPSVTPSQTAAPTETATATQSPTPILMPTDTPTPTPTPSATSTHTTSPTPTNTPTATQTPRATATPTPKRPTPTSQTTYPAPALLEPGDGAQLAGMQRFTWQWNGPPLEEGHAFDLRIWSLQEEQQARPRRGAAAPTRDREIEVELSYVPAVVDYGPGDYYWTIVVVKVSAGGIPQVVGEWGEERGFTYSGPSAPASPVATQPAPTPIPPSPTAAPFPSPTP